MLRVDKLRLYASLLSLVLLLVGCGGGGGGSSSGQTLASQSVPVSTGGGSDPVTTPGSPNIPGDNEEPVENPQPPVVERASVEFQFVLARSLPGSINSIRFTGLNIENQILYGPKVENKSPSIVLTEVPIEVKRFRLEFLSNGVVLGLADVDVNLLPGQRSTIVDPDFEDVNFVVTNLQISPISSTLAQGREVQFRATATLSDTSQEDVSRSVIWSSSNGDVASINQFGLVEAASTGTVEIKAALGEQSATADVTVTPAVVDELALTPADSELFVTEQKQFRLTATYSDETVVEVTNQAVWEIDDSSLASLTSTGLATGLAAGETTVKGTFDGVSRQVLLTVVDEPIVLSSLRVEPPVALTAPGSSRYLKAIARTNSGKDIDVTKEVTWTSGDSIAVQVSNEAGKEGYATFPGQSLNQEITVEATHPQFAQPAKATMFVNRFVYIAHSFSNDVWVYISDGSTGHLSYSSRTSFFRSFGMATHPNGLFLYVSSERNNQLAGLTVNPLTGAVTKIDGSEVDTGDSPRDLAIHPSGRFLFASNGGNLGKQGISAFSVDSESGMLTPVSPDPFDLERRISKIDIHPRGTNLYGSYMDPQFTDRIFLNNYSIDQQDGSLILTQQFPIPSRYDDVAVLKNGRFVYASYPFGDSFFVYSVDQETGELEEIPESPVAAGNEPNTMAIHPNSRFLYAADGNGRSVSVFSVASDSGIPTKIGSFPTTLSPSNLGIDATGRHLYAINGKHRPDQNVDVYTIDPTSGLLSNRQVLVAGDSPIDIETTP